MNNEKSIVAGMVSLVFVTAVISFILAFFLFNGFDLAGSKSYVSFDKDEVSKGSVEKFNQIKGILKNTYYDKVDENKLLEGAISGMTDSLRDPYTVYFTREQMNSFSERTEGEYVGIGMHVIMDNDGILTIVEAFEGSPAKKAGLTRDDKIIKVDGKDVTSIKDENLIINMIKGKENTNVKITIYRPSEEKSIDLDILRKKIKVSNIKWEMLDGNIGYIRILMFDNDAYSYFSKALEELLEKGLKGLIIDVRDDPGGDYEQVVEIADRLLPKGLIVYTEDKNKKRDEKLSDEREFRYPLAVLVNGNSASASEVLSGAIKDHDKGKLIGTKTFGKGLVQQVYGFKDGSGLKLTVSRYFTPSGKCIQGIGIEPDIKVESLEEFKDYPVSNIPREKDVQFKKAYDYIKGKSSNSVF
ncbi:S41 family peptidase [Pseudobacteroides cellulosolvens]|uniref:Carboxyl-terminal protease n=1 Tax=Pseudobacteroides cellulosolvens ATCC 35603 = DSM 2933 TaxID=398512 RepID=A0A0L6JNF0_9FIRM|nr:S41 family peptidase [Pseudobacteroides cellulosolvens]KNY27346.1 carboxyl-terminal protease [Pseudobacteroides cellulosolvens ATCC 35603 = DSM 2933]